MGGFSICMFVFLGFVRVILRDRFTKLNKEVKLDAWANAHPYIL